MNFKITHLVALFIALLLLPVIAHAESVSRYELSVFYIFNIIGYIIIYLSVPFLIRYVILRRPLLSKWTALTIIFFLFVIFSIHIGATREKQDKEFARRTGITYTPQSHMIGSPILYVTMFSAYFILRRGRKDPTDGDDYIEKISREADARPVEESRKRATYSAPDKTESNEEFIALLKSTVIESRFEIIPDEDLVKICKRARLINAQSKKTDTDFIIAVNTLSKEVKKRGLS